MRRQQLAAITTSGSAASSPFILHPTHLEVPAESIIGAASVHGILGGW